MPENHENDSNFLGVQAIAISPTEVEMMHSSCKAAADMAQAGVDAAKEHEDPMGVMAYTALQFGLIRCVQYFEEMLGHIEKPKEERRNGEPDLNELNDKDREN